MYFFLLLTQIPSIFLKLDLQFSSSHSSYFLSINLTILCFLNSKAIFFSHTLGHSSRSHNFRRRFSLDLNLHWIYIFFGEPIKYIIVLYNTIAKRYLILPKTLKDLFGLDDYWWQRFCGFSTNLFLLEK